MAKRGRKTKPLRELTEEEKAEIKEIYCVERRGTYHIAKMVHIHEPVIKRYLVEEGLLRNTTEMLQARSERYAYEFPADVTRDMVKRYTNGDVSIWRLAIDHDVSSAVIKRILEKEGVAIRSHEESQKARIGKANVKKRSKTLVRGGETIGEGG